MNYEAYFNVTRQNNITFSSAYNMLASLLSVMSTLEDKLLTELVKQYSY